MLDDKFKEAIKANKESANESKKASQSLTVRAAAINAFLPIATYFIARKLEMSNEDSAALAAGLFAALSSIIAFGQRRASGLAIILVLLLPLSVGCKVTRVSVKRAYVEADQKTLDAVGPRLSKYEEKHGSDLSKKLTAELLDSWQARIDEEKKSWK